MKKFYYLLAALLVIAVVVSLPGCGRTDSAKSANPLSGTWEYTDAEYDISTVYVLKDDGTGTYTMKVGDTEVVYELKYETKDDHLLVTYVNNEIFTEEDVFDSPFRFSDPDTLILKDSFGEELTYVRK